MKTLSSTHTNPEYPHVGAEGATGAFNGLVGQLDAFPFALPQFSTAERDALADVLEGAIIENTDTGTLQLYDGADWADVGAGLGMNAAELAIGDLGLTLGVGAQTLTVEVGGESAVLTFVEAGIDISRTGLRTADIGLGGGLIANAAKLADAIIYALNLLIDAKDFASPPALRLKGPGHTVAMDYFHPGVPAANYALKGAPGLVIEAKSPLTVTVGAGVTDGLTVI